MSSNVHHTMYSSIGGKITLLSSPRYRVFERVAVYDTVALDAYRIRETQPYAVTTWQLYLTNAMQRKHASV